MPGQHSDIAPAVDALYWFIFWCSVAIFSIVVIAIIYFVFKYRSESVRDKLEEQVYWYKADAHDDFKIGAPEFWQHHSNNFNDGYDSDEEFQINKRKGPIINVKKTYS